MGDRKRLVHQLDTPYSTAQWPQTSQGDQDEILELLCSLLSPLGDYRRTYISPSRGKRSKGSRRSHNRPVVPSSTMEKPPPPELSAFVDVGLAGISRSLQDLQTSKAEPSKEKEKDNESGTDAGADSKGASTKQASPYSVIFVARSGQSSAFHGHFPQMVATASESCPDQPAIRLVGFSKACEDRLSKSLGIPRASSVGLRANAPLSQALVELVRKKVAPIKVTWLKEAATGYQETKINAIEAPIGPKKQRTSKKRKA